MSENDKIILLGQYNALKADVTKEIDRRTPSSPLMERESAVRYVAAQIFRERQKATTDPLSGLKNKRFHEEMLSKELSRIKRHGGTLGLLVGDVWKLKVINDRHGHIVGDSAIQTIGKVFRKLKVRHTDVASRIGGDEFAEIFPDTEPDRVGLTPKNTLLIVAFRFMHSLAENPITLDSENHTKPLYLNIGLTLSRPGDTPESIKKRADNALYLAKDLFEPGQNSAVLALQTESEIQYELAKEVDGVMTLLPIKNTREDLGDKKQ